MPRYRLNLSVTVDLDAASVEQAYNSVHQLVPASIDLGQGPVPITVSGLSVDIYEPPPPREPAA